METIEDTLGKYTPTSHLDPSNLGKEFLFVVNNRVINGTLHMVHPTNTRVFAVRYDTYREDGSILEHDRISSHNQNTRLYKLSEIMDNRNNPGERRILAEARRQATYAEDGRKTKKTKKHKKYKKYNPLKKTKKSRNIM